MKRVRYLAEFKTKVVKQVTDLRQRVVEVAKWFGMSYIIFSVIKTHMGSDSA